MPPSLWAAECSDLPVALITERIAGFFLLEGAWEMPASHVPLDINMTLDLEAQGIVTPAAVKELSMVSALRRSTVALTTSMRAVSLLLTHWGRGGSPGADAFPLGRYCELW